MAADIDAYAVLGNIGAHRDTFAGVAHEISKVARMIVIKQIKSKSSTLGLLREIREAIGDLAFQLIVDGMTEAQVKSSVAKFDKYRRELKVANSDARWRHLLP